MRFTFLLLLLVARVGAAELDAHLEAVRKQLPSREFTIVSQPPFVVIGDEPAEMVQSRAIHTVKWAVDRLKQDFFSKDPAEIIDIWLFKDTESYKKNVARIFGDEPDTPFGYYSAQHHALIMNIATGGGTLVHEIVHPFMRANFPACPPWFNEGLGSLYEQCRDEGGHIHGLTNWRLAGLQEAVRAGTVPSFAKLTAMDEDEFYHKDKGTNYGQARYLCYYLQEHGLLVRFYREFRARHAQDPTGYETLQLVLGKPDMPRFQQTWEQYVLKLRFP